MRVLSIQTELEEKGRFPSSAFFFFISSFEAKVNMGRKTTKDNFPSVLLRQT